MIRATLLPLLLALALLPILDARDVRPGPKEQKEALESFRKFNQSDAPSLRALGVSKLRDMDFVWRVEELVKVIRKESQSKKEEDFVVVQEAIDVLGNTRDRDSVKALMRAVIEEKKSEIRMALMEGLGGLSFDERAEELPWDEVDKVLDEGLASTDPFLIISSIDSFGGLRRTDKFDALVAHLGHTDWKVRSAVVQALLNIFDKKHPRGLGELAAQLEKEEGKLRTQIRDVLTSLTGWDCGYDADCWKAKVQQFEAGQQQLVAASNAPLEPDETVVSYFAIDISSDRLLILIDVSPSMLERYDGPEYTVVVNPKDWEDNPKGLAKEGELSKWDVAREETIALIKNLTEKQSFNMIFFAGEPDKWQAALVPANERWREKAIQKIESIRISGKGVTDMYGALEAGFKMAGGGVSREEGAVGIDTMIFFTDGMPTAGEINIQTTPVLDDSGNQFEDPKTGKLKVISPSECYRRISSIVKRINNKGKVTIHTIGIGEHAEPLLYQLAKDSGGKYRKVEDVMAERAKKRKLLEASKGDK